MSVNLKVNGSKQFIIYIVSCFEKKNRINYKSLGCLKMKLEREREREKERERERVKCLLILLNCADVHCV